MKLIDDMIDLNKKNKEIFFKLNLLKVRFYYIDRLNHKNCLKDINYL